mmetsp:Transcript_9531/g.31339  ORF Transcript_9531/g.31339 Transcript_9531/m.31339 type:complete len:105 (+) Transcript_9531:832-1146(+)
MSYLSFLVRDLVSATYFSVIGNLCKVGTIAVNYVIWDNHASPTGIVALFVALAGCAFYQQAPPRPAAVDAWGVAWLRKAVGYSPVPSSPSAAAPESAKDRHTAA